MKSPLLRAAVVVSTLALVLVPASPAAAQSTAVLDAAGDTWKATFNMETGEESAPEPAGSAANTDLLRTAVKHAGRRLVIKATYADLKRAENRFGFMANVRTNEGLKREVGVETYSRNGWGGATELTRPNGRPVPCKGIRHAIDFDADTVLVSVPRTCLSSPRWIQATVGAFGIPEGQTGTTFTVYVDNGHNSSADEPRTWTKRLRKG